MLLLLVTVVSFFLCFVSFPFFFPVTTARPEVVDRQVKRCQTQLSRQKRPATSLSLSRSYCCLTRLVFFKCYLIPAHMKIESFNTAAGNNRRRWGGHFVVSNEDVTAGIWKQEKCSEKRNRKKKVVADYYKREKKKERISNDLDKPGADVFCFI